MRRTTTLILKILGGCFGSIFVLLLLLVVLLRLPAVQNYLTKRVIAYVSSKTHTRIGLKRVYIFFPKSVVVEGVFAEDMAHDTLLYLGEMKANVNMLALLKKRVEITNLSLDNVNANIKRNQSDSVFNFAFLIKAFSTGAKKTNEKSERDTSSPWQISLNEVNLENIRGSYNDGLTGTTIHGNVGSLNLKMNALDIAHLNFSANELTLMNSSLSVLITGASTEEAVDSVRAQLPSLALNKASLKNISFSLENSVSGQRIKGYTGNLVVQPEKIDLNAQMIKVKSLYMDSSNAILSFKKEQGNTKEETTSATGIEQNWTVQAEEVQLRRVDFGYDITNTPVLASAVDYNHLHFSNIALNLSNAIYSPKLSKGNVQHLSFTERSGFVLEDLKANAVYDEHHAELSDLSLTTPHTHIGNHLEMHYASLSGIGKNIGELLVNANLQHTNVALNDVLFFAPSLKNQPPFNGAIKTIAVNGNIRGRVKDITIAGLNAQTGATELALDGHITGLPDAVNAFYDVQLKNLSTTCDDLESFTGNKLPGSIQIPPTLQLSGSLKGSLVDAAVQIRLKTSAGDMDADVSFHRLQGDTQYVANINTQSLNLGYILMDSGLLGPLTASVHLKGQNLSPATIRADVDAQIQSMVFNKYDYSNISLTANANHNVYAANLSINDTNLVMDMKANLSLVKDSEYAQVNLNLGGADLQRLDLMKDAVKVSGDVSVNMNGPLDNLSGYSDINNVVVVKDRQTYRIGSLLALAANDKKHSTIKTKSSIVNIEYDGSGQPAGLSKALTTYVNHYFHVREPRDTTLIDTMQNFTLLVDVLPQPVVNALVPGLEQFNGADIQADFNNAKQNLDVVAGFPGVVYAGTTFDNLQTELHGDENQLKYSIAFDQMQSGSVKLSETSLKGALKNDSLDFALKVQDIDSGNKLIIAGTVAQPTQKEYVIRISGKDLVFRNQQWNIPDDNYIHFQAGNGFYVHRFDLSYGQQLLSVNSEQDNASAPLKVEFKQFQLGTLSQIIENDTSLVRGVVNGNVELRNLQHTPAFVSDLKIDSVSFRQNAIGNIRVKADNLTGDKYSAQVSITGSDNDVQATGYYASTAASNQLNFKVDIKKLQLSSIEGFTNGQLRNSSGFITASLDVTGSGKQPVINGNINFKNAVTNVAYINNSLKLNDEVVRIDTKGVYFKSFTLQDPTGQTAVINGAVYSSDFFRHMNFDLSLTTKHFMVMNTDIKDNPLFYGHVILSSDLTIKGDQSLPVINANAKLLSGSSFTVVIPSSKINVDRGEGVVVLIDTFHKNLDGIMRVADTVPVAISGFKGINLSANLDISKETSFKLIVDKTSGDSLVVRGDGVLSFAMDETGKQTLTGTYTLSSGSYKASFQGVIKRQFTIRDGSSITWNGNPTEANVDITALYATRASPVNLLSAELGNLSSADKNQYQQLLNFLVVMNMRGELLKPTITFQLDMADQDKNDFSGSVYAEVNNLNQNQGELNQQVFALLVLGSFMPVSASGGSGENPVSTLARNSVNQVLSDQLNSLSGRFLKGVDLNFGIQSNDQYSATSVTQQTQVNVALKKEFLNNRLSVQVGTSLNVQQNNGGTLAPNGASGFTGDFNVEYKITKDGRYRLKAFRVNQYESIIYGLLYKTGVGLVYTRDFNAVKELFAHKQKNKQNEDP